MKCRVVNKFKEPYDVYIGRPGPWGNPFDMKDKSDFERDRVCDLYYDLFHNSKSMKARAVRELRGKVLGCYCKPKRCHGDIIADYVNGFYKEEEQ
jgi:hypothetical protein